MGYWITPEGKIVNTCADGHALDHRDWLVKNYKSPIRDIPDEAFNDGYIRVTMSGRSCNAEGRRRHIKTYLPKILSLIKQRNADMAYFDINDPEEKQHLTFFMPGGRGDMIRWFLTT